MERTRKFKWEQEIRTTERSRQCKKHYTQMIEEELDFLYNELVKSMRSEQNYKMVRKLEEKMKAERIQIYTQDLMDVLNDATAENIIEYNETDVRGKLQKRILLRSHKQYLVNNNTYANLCVVYELTTKKFITAYFNGVYDTHQTLREDIYDKDLVIIK